MRYDPPMWIDGHCYGSWPTPEHFDGHTVTPKTKAKRRAASRQAAASRRKNRTRS